MINTRALISKTAIVFHQAALPSVQWSVENLLTSNPVNGARKLNIFLVARGGDRVGIKGSGL